MRGRFFLEERAPETAEVFGSLKFHRTEAAGIPYVKAWRGKQGRPYAHYRFKSPESREEWIAKQKEAEKANEVYKAARKAERQVKKGEMTTTIEVGTILRCSWGYEQTNVDYFQVTSKSGASVTLRAIAAREVPGSEGFMSCKVRPSKDGFLKDSQPFVKRIGPYGVSMDHGTAHPVPETETSYCSWYA